MHSETKAPSRVHALLCTLALLICVLVTRPFVEMGVNDDWSYIRTAQILAETGHVAYNGWATAILGWQLLVGALFIKLFGFSFTIVRVPVFLLALFTTYLLHRVLVRFGFNAWYAVLATLTVVLSPLFLPYVFTFMSDVCGLLCILICIYACQRALQAGSHLGSLGWLYFAAVSNILDGTVRQTAWLGVLVIVPCTAWLLRQRKGMLLHGAALWLVGFVSVLACMHWYAQQPYAAIEKIIDGPINGFALQQLISRMTRAFLSLFLFSLPVVIIFPFALRDLGRKRSRQILAVLSLTILFLILYGYHQLHAGHSIDSLLLPWMINTVSIQGIMQFKEVIGQQFVVLQIPLRAALTLVTLFAGGSCAAHLLFMRAPSADKRTGPQYGLTWQQTLFLLLPFSMAYVALLLPRAASQSHTIFDRYLTPLVLVCTILLLRYLQEHASPKEQFVSRALALSTAALLLLTYFAVAGTHDVFALDRARLAAANEVTQSGVPRTALNGGFDYDGWTQLLAAGYVNDPHIVRPAGAYHLLPFNPDQCYYYFGPETPDIKPEYALAFEPFTCFKPSRFAPVPYHTWLPPHDRSIYVQKMP